MGQRHQPLITAKTKEEFDKISALLMQLPDIILEQITECKFGGVGLECTIENNRDKNIFLPNYVTQITHFGDYVGFYANKYFFKLLYENNKVPTPTYTFYTEK